MGKRPDREAVRRMDSRQERGEHQYWVMQISVSVDALVFTR